MGAFVELTTEALDAAIGRVRFVPTLNAGCGEVMGFHRHLLADRVRTAPSSRRCDGRCGPQTSSSTWVLAPECSPWLPPSRAQAP